MERAVMNDLVRTGGCLCGAVRYQVQGEPFRAGVCHCTICRKLTGSAFAITAEWRSENFSMTGDLQTYERRQFCPSCGSRLFYLYEGGVEIFLGTLDEAPHGIEPTVEIFTRRREHWLPAIEGVPQHAEGPPKV